MIEKTDCITDEEKQKCPLGIDEKIDIMKEDFDKTAILLHDIAFIKIYNGSPEPKEYHISEVLKWILEATETKRKILQTERLWHKSKYIIGFFSFIRKSIIPLLLAAILGMLTRIAISNIRFEEKLNTHEIRLQNIENKK
jgi:hypothetical protein